MPSLAPFLPTSVSGSKVGYEATLSRSPVFALMMTTVPDTALVSLIRWAREFWAYHCRLELTVSRTSLPSTAGVVELAAAGMIVPSRPCSNVCRPGVPWRRASSMTSTPPPGSPSAVT